MALRAALREDPDVVLIGEMRDLETVESALKIAETGHLTFGTLHTNSAMQTINRIIDIFPSGQQGQIRTQLSLVLEGIVCQTLLPKIGGGRVVALEIMIPTPAIRNLTGAPADPTRLPLTSKPMTEATICASRARMGAANTVSRTRPQMSGPVSARRMSDTLREALPALDVANR